MKRSLSVLIASGLLCAGLASAETIQAAQTPMPASAVPSQTTVGVASVEMDMVVAGWSVQKDILRKAVVNEKNEKIGTISDIVISPNPDAKLPSASFAIIGVGGFLGIGKRDVAIPMEQIKLQNKKLVLSGATKEVLKAMPAFDYKRK